MAVYDFTVKDRKGNDVPMSNFKGKVLLIVNTATGCGFTPQYEGLEKLWQEYHDKGLEILDFPCDQFGHQAPGTDDEIHQFCMARYATSFDNFKKIEVNGENAEPLYEYLKSQRGFAGFTGRKGWLMGLFSMIRDRKYKTSADIKWNFTKFLVNREGEVVERFEPTVEPAEIADKIAALL
ncbi:glutathione peroxidase [bacterium]|nr:glutathione peroxidase [bacterium]